MSIAIISVSAQCEDCLLPGFAKGPLTRKLPLKLNESAALTTSGHSLRHLLGGFLVTQETKNAYQDVLTNVRGLLQCLGFFSRQSS